MNPSQQPIDSGSSDAPQSTNSGPPSWLSMGLQVGVAVAALAVLGFKNPNLLLSGAVFLLTLSVLVFVHEWGHYQFALWAGMQVNRFALGFPPWIFTKRVNNIDYSIGALPIGGMVDIAGLGSEEEMVATGKGETVENATREARPDAPAGQKQFQDASLGWRFLTLFAGPMMNFVFAFVVYIGLFSIVGLPIQAPTTTIDMVIRDSPASKAGLQAGDRITAVNGKPAATSEVVAKAIQNSKGENVNVTIDRAGKTLTLPLKPVVDEMENEPGKIEHKMMIGIQFDIATTGHERVNIKQAAQAGLLQSVGITRAIFGILGRAVTNNLSKNDKRSVGGPVKIAQTIGKSASKGWEDILMLAAGLSVNLALMNLLPFPALDGGRILFLGYELVMRKPFDPRKEGLVHMVGIVLLLSFMLLITIHDVLPMFRG